MSQTIRSPKFIFDKVVEHTLELEGGYVNDPLDRGGETKYGISKRQYPHIDIKNLSHKDAIDIYYQDYWLAYQCQKLKPHAAALLFDAVVNHSPRDAIKKIQRACSATPDGIIGRQTLSFANKFNATQLIESMLANRASFYAEICIRNPTQKKFLLGWQRRLFSLQQFIFNNLLARTR